MLHLVIAQMVPLLMNKVSAKTVNTHVVNVLVKSIPVLNVLISENRSQIVVAQPLSMMMDITPNVNHVKLSV